MRIQDTIPQSVIDENAAYFSDMLPRELDLHATAYRLKGYEDGLDSLCLYVNTAPVVYQTDVRGNYTMRVPSNSKNVMQLIVTGQVATVQDVHVAQSMRGWGAGRRMCQAAAVLMKKEGMTSISSAGAATADALLAGRSAYGQEPLRFFDSGRPEEDVPISFDDALVQAHKAGEASRSGSSIKLLGVHVDLSKIDTTQWELPTHIN